MTEQNTYNDCAPQYAQWIRSREADGLAAHPELTAFFDLVGDVRGRTVLDACCGEGYVPAMIEQGHPQAQWQHFPHAMVLEFIRP